MKIHYPACDCLISAEISFPLAKETGTGKTLKLSTCRLKADTDVEFHAGFVDSRCETLLLV